MRLRQDSRRGEEAGRRRDRPERAHHAEPGRDDARRQRDAAAGHSTCRCSSAGRRPAARTRRSRSRPPTSSRSSMCSTPRARWAWSARCSTRSSGRATSRKRAANTRSCARTTPGAPARRRCSPWRKRAPAARPSTGRRRASTRPRSWAGGVIEQPAAGGPGAAHRLVAVLPHLGAARALPRHLRRSLRGQAGARTLRRRPAAARRDRGEASCSGRGRCTGSTRRTAWATTSSFTRTRPANVGADDFPLPAPAGAQARRTGTTTRWPITSRRRAAGARITSGRSRSRPATARRSWWRGSSASTTITTRS